MATVPDKSIGQGAKDKPFEGINRRIAGPISGTATPEYVGEKVLETDTGLTYKATDMTVDGWQQVMPTR